MIDWVLPMISERVTLWPLAVSAVIMSIGMDSSTCRGPSGPA